MKDQVRIGNALMIGLVALCMLAAGAGRERAARAEGKIKLFFRLARIKEPPATRPSLKDRAKKLLEQELARQPQVVTDIGEVPKGDPELLKVLKAKGLTGYELQLQIRRTGHTVHPPEPGKVYKVLMVEVEVAIDAQKLPLGQLSLAGEGTTQVGTEVSRFNEKERVELLHEALAGAIREAVTKSVAKLSAPEKPPPRGKGKRRARRGARRGKK